MVCKKYCLDNKIGDSLKIFFPLYYDGIHTLYRHMIDHPPEGCEYITRKNLEKNIIYTKYYDSSNFRRFFDQLWNISSIFIPPTISRGIIEKNEDTFNSDLIYANSFFPMKDMPYVIDCEQADSFYRGIYSFFPFYKKIIEKLLTKENCKKILPWTKKAKESLERNYEISGFEEKIEIVRLAYNSTDIEFTRNKDSIDFLFVGSINVQFKNDFYYKGGLEAIEAFIKIREEYDDIRLIIRSAVDDKIKKIVSSYDDIKLIDYFLPKDNYFNLLKNSSILLYPSFVTPGMAFVEVMDYYLPIITTDYWANPEYVEPRYNGFLLSMPKTVEEKKPIPCSLRYPRNLGYHKTDENQINEISKYMKYFIENPKEIERMGKNSKKMVETGPYSMEKKNKQLMRIYEECLKK